MVPGAAHFTPILLSFPTQTSAQRRVVTRVPSCTARLMADGAWCCSFYPNPSLLSYPDISSEVCRDPGAFLYSTAHGGWCLVLHQRAPCSWYEARARCVGWGGRLAVLRSEQVYEQLKSHLRQTLQVSGDYWIGLRDSELEWQQGELCCF